MCVYAYDVHLQAFEEEKVNNIYQNIILRLFLFTFLSAPFHVFRASLYVYAFHRTVCIAAIYIPIDPRPPLPPPTPFPHYFSMR